MKELSLYYATNRKHEGFYIRCWDYGYVFEEDGKDDVYFFNRLAFIS